MAQEQPPRGAAAQAPVLLPPPVQVQVQVVRRVLDVRVDVPSAYKVVPYLFDPVDRRVPEKETAYYKFNKERDDTKDEDANIVKRQVYNSYNHVGNKRREIYYYLPAEQKYKGLLKRLSNELQGLEHSLFYKLADYRTFMPNAPLDVPDHFAEYPKLVNPIPKKVTKK